MKSIKDYPVRIIKKGKKRGRPSKQELVLTKIISHYAEKPKFKKAMSKAMSDLFIYGSCIQPELFNNS